MFPINRRRPQFCAFLGVASERKKKKKKRQRPSPPDQMQVVKHGEYEMKRAVPNLQVIEEQMRVCQVEDHFFHHQADTHGRRGVLLEEGKVARE